MVCPITQGDHKKEEEEEDKDPLFPKTAMDLMLAGYCGSRSAKTICTFDNFSSTSSSSSRKYHCTRVLNSNDISIGLAVFAGLTTVTDRQRDRQTDRQTTLLRL